MPQRQLNTLGNPQTDAINGVLPGRVNGITGAADLVECRSFMDHLEKVLHMTRLKVLAGDRLAAGNHQAEFAFVPVLLR